VGPEKPLGGGCGGALEPAQRVDGRYGSYHADQHRATEATGSDLAPYGAVGLVAFRGREPEAISLIDESREDATRRGEGIGLSVLDWAQAVLYNGLGRYEQACAAALRAALAGRALDGAPGCAAGGADGEANLDSRDDASDVPGVADTIDVGDVIGVGTCVDPLGFTGRNTCQPSSTLGSVKTRGAPRYAEEI